MVLSPLTDPRSLASTLFVHSALLVIASLAAWTVASPAAGDAPERDARRARPGRQPGPSELRRGRPRRARGRGADRGAPLGRRPRDDGRGPRPGGRRLAVGGPAQLALGRGLAAGLARPADRASASSPARGSGEAAGPAAVRGAGSAGASGRGPSSSAPANAPGRSPTSSTAPGAWRAAARSTWPSASCWPASTSSPPTPGSPSSSTTCARPIFSDPQGRKGLMPATAANKARARDADGRRRPRRRDRPPDRPPRGPRPAPGGDLLPHRRRPDDRERRRRDPAHGAARPASRRSSSARGRPGRFGPAPQAGHRRPAARTATSTSRPSPSRRAEPRPRRRGFRAYSLPDPARFVSNPRDRRPGRPAHQTPDHGPANRSGMAPLATARASPFSPS